MAANLAEHPPLRLGLAGFGLIGRRRAQIAAADYRVVLTGIADPDPASRQEAAALYKIPVYAEARALLRQPLDALLVAAPNLHAVPIAQAALRRGLHVLMEKPPGANLGQCRRLRTAAETAGRTLKFGFNHRYHPAIFRLVQSVRAGDIGQIINIRARYGHGGRPGYEQEWRGDEQNVERLAQQRTRLGINRDLIKRGRFLTGRGIGIGDAGQNDAMIRGRDLRPAAADQAKAGEAEAKRRMFREISGHL